MRPETSLGLYSENSWGMMSVDKRPPIVLIPEGLPSGFCTKHLLETFTKISIPGLLAWQFSWTEMWLRCLHFLINTPNDSDTNGQQLGKHCSKSFALLRGHSLCPNLCFCLPADQVPHSHQSFFSYWEWFPLCSISQGVTVSTFPQSPGVNTFHHLHNPS